VLAARRARRLRLAVVARTQRLAAGRTSMTTFPSEQGDLFAQPPKSDARKGWDGAVQGMSRAAAHAERDVPEWAIHARAFLERYIREVRPDRLIAPDVRKWSEAHGLEAPPNNYAWGGVFNKASRTGLLVADGFQNYGDGVMHTQSVRVWRVA
jgi:hypothetical protein